MDFDHATPEQVAETKKVIQDRAGEFSEAKKWCQDLGLDFQNGLLSSL